MPLDTWYHVNTISKYLPRAPRLNATIFLFWVVKKFINEQISVLTMNEQAGTPSQVTEKAPLPPASQGTTYGEALGQLGPPADPTGRQRWQQWAASFHSFSSGFKIQSPDSKLNILMAKKMLFTLYIEWGKEPLFKRRNRFCESKITHKTPGTHCWCETASSVTWHGEAWALLRPQDQKSTTAGRGEPHGLLTGFSGNWRAVVTAEITPQPQANHESAGTAPHCRLAPGPGLGLKPQAVQTRSPAHSRAAREVLSLFESIQRHDLLPSKIKTLRNFLK